MNIIYFSGMFSGLAPFLKDGKEEITGMPAFYKVFKSFLDDRQIDKFFFLILIDIQKFGHFSIKLPENYQNKLIVLPYYYSNRLTFLVAALRSILSGLIICLRQKIAFIYSHGTASSIGSLIGIMARVKHFRRIYGTFLYEKIQRGTLNIFNTDFFEYFSFKLPAHSIIMTNDGTKGDEVFKKIGNKNTPFYFLINGIDKIVISPEKPSFIDDRQPFISYIARIDRWKRQHLLIEALNILQIEGVDFPQVYLIGQTYSKTYKKEIEQIILKYNLQRKVQFSGEIPRNQVRYILMNTQVTFSLYDVSNLGNVFLEALASNTPIIAININNSLVEIPDNCYIKLNDSSPVSLANKIKELIYLKIDVLALKTAMKAFTSENIIDWETRVKIEKNILINF